jgi:molybdopterin converting factor small subunit
MMRVLFFGPVAEQFGARELQLDFYDGMTLQDVATQLRTQNAQAFKLVSLIAVNNAQTKDMSLVLHDHDEIAFMSKFSGG